MTTKDNHIGEQRQMNNGMYATIIEKTGQDTYRKPLFTVQFEDGTKVYDKNYTYFKNGQIQYPVNHIGERKLMNNGLYATIIEQGQKSKNNRIRYNIQFEDNVVVEDKEYGNFVKCNIRHPQLDTKGLSNYLGFEVKYYGADVDETKIYYRAKCLCCGKKEHMTPQEMIEHRRMEPFEQMVEIDEVKENDEYDR